MISDKLEILLIDEMNYQEMVASGTLDDKETNLYSNEVSIIYIL